ncbi:MAG: hypothetical protein ABIH45_07130 [Candidatus Omnitrophota bacterium]
MRRSSKIANISSANLAGFGFNTVYAIIYKWSLQEFCWSAWLAALFFSWSCVVVGLIRVILNVRLLKQELKSKFSFLRNISDPVFILLLCLVAMATAWIMYNLYCYLFGFYGLFLSVFAEMQPHSYFGRNGFINSDFFTPVMYLLVKFWPMIVGVLVSNLDIFSKVAPWRLMLLPFRSGEIVRIHVMIVIMPFLCLLAWAIFRQGYQPITIIILMGIFYFFAPPNRLRYN